MAKYPFALQLYTVRDHIEKDPQGTLHKVKEAGYDKVEIAGTAGLTNVEFKKCLDAAKLDAVCVHTSYEEIAGNVSETIETAKIFEIAFVAIAGIDGRLTPDNAGWTACGKALDQGGAKLREAGIQLCYHNHAHEFEAIDGEYPLDILFGAAAPENLAAEIDVFWVRFAGLDPAEVIAKHNDRCPLIHVKDMRDEESRAFAEVGSGILDWPGIFHACETAKAQWYIVEQDTCEEDSLKSAEISARFMARQ